GATALYAPWNASRRVLIPSRPQPAGGALMRACGKRERGRPRWLPHLLRCSQAVVERTRQRHRTRSRSAQRGRQEWEREWVRERLADGEEGGHVVLPRPTCCLTGGTAASGRTAGSSRHTPDHRG